MNTEPETKESLAEWNDKMLQKYHGEGTIFESKNMVLRYVEKIGSKR